MENYKRNALIFKAFCDENRLKIIESLREGEKCACKILEELDIAQSTLSHHMKILIESSIVTSRKVGKWTNYRLNDQGTQEAKDILEQITEKSDTYGVDNACGTEGD